MYISNQVRSHSNCICSSEYNVIPSRWLCCARARTLNYNSPDPNSLSPRPRTHPWLHTRRGIPRESPRGSLRLAPRHVVESATTVHNTLNLEISRDVWLWRAHRSRCEDRSGLPRVPPLGEGGCPDCGRGASLQVLLRNYCEVISQFISGPVINYCA